MAVELRGSYAFGVKGANVVREKGRIVNEPVFLRSASAQMSLSRVYRPVHLSLEAASSSKVSSRFKAGNSQNIRMLILGRNAGEKSLGRPRIHCASSSSTADNSEQPSILRKFYDQFQEEMRRDIGLDFEDIAAVFQIAFSKIVRFTLAVMAALGFQKEKKVQSEEFSQLTAYFKAFSTWMDVKNWMDFEKWGIVRWAAAIILTLFSAVSVTMGNQVVRRNMERMAAERWLQTAIPEPTPENILKAEKYFLRQKLPRGLILSKFTIENGTPVRDPLFVGEKIWADNEPTPPAPSSPQNPSKGRNWRKKLADWQAEISKRYDPLDKSVSYEKQADWSQELDLSSSGSSVLASPESQSDRDTAAYKVQHSWWKFRPGMSYPWLISMLSKDQIVSAVYSEDLSHLYVRVRNGFPNEFKVEIPVDPNLHAQILEAGIDSGIIPRSPLVPVLRSVAIVLPSLLILFCINDILWRARTTLENALSDLRHKTDATVSLPEEALLRDFTTWADVVLPNSFQKSLIEMLNFLDAAMKFYRKKVRVPRGLLISGPPGTGKTMLMRALQHSTSLPIVYASGAEFVDADGGGAERLNEVFFQARCLAPALVFIDEIDAIAGGEIKDGDPREAAFSQLLAELDGEEDDTDLDRFSFRQAIMLIGATNRPEVINKRLMSAGRIDKHIAIEKPDPECRIRLFGVHSRGRKLDDDVDYTKLIARTVGFTGADIRALINEASIMTVRRKGKLISQQDFIDALDKQMYEGSGMALTPEDERLAYESVPEEVRYLLAIHEAGHVLLAHLFPSFDHHGLTQIAPAGRHDALSMFYPRQRVLEFAAPTVGYMKMQMVVNQGGRCAEILLRGASNLTDGCSKDLIFISQAARELAMATSNPKFGLLPLYFREGSGGAEGKADKETLMPLTWGDSVEIAKMSAPLSELFTREVTKYMNESEKVAMDALKANRHILDKLIDHLFKDYKIKGQEAYDMIHSMNPVLLPDYIDMGLENEEADLERELVLDPHTPGLYEQLDIYAAPLYK